jgi:hypothetical protein
MNTGNSASRFRAFAPETVNMLGNYVEKIQSIYELVDALFNLGGFEILYRQE